MTSALAPQNKNLRIAFVVSHPIQYYVPIYRDLSTQNQLEVRVFYTCRGNTPAFDSGFCRNVAWDIPLTDGYHYSVLNNIASDPGTHHFRGIQTPSLLKEVLAWAPDLVHVTGYPFYAHLSILWNLRRHNIYTLFRGDSHLLDTPASGLRNRAKQFLLERIYRLPNRCLYVGTANRAYYRRFGVPEANLFFCPHTIEVARFSNCHEELERAAAEWRIALQIPIEHKVLLFAGKFEEKKRPVELAHAFSRLSIPNLHLLFVGDGHLRPALEQIQRDSRAPVHILPFQNQRQMPLVYRLGDFFTLPSGFGETWGLAVNEAMACGRPVIVSDRVGCAQDIINSGINGCIFKHDDWDDFSHQLNTMLSQPWETRREQIQQMASAYDTSAGTAALIELLKTLS